MCPDRNIMKKSREVQYEFHVLMQDVEELCC